MSPLFFRFALGFNAPYNYDCDHDYITSVNQALMMIKVGQWSHEKKMSKITLSVPDELCVVT